MRFLIFFAFLAGSYTSSFAYDEFNLSSSKSSKRTRKNARHGSGKSQALDESKAKKCSPKEEIKKQEQLDDCIAHFTKSGLNKSYKENERINPKLCPSKTEITAQLSAGCWEAFSFSPLEMHHDLMVLIGVDSYKYENQILKICKEKPRGPSNGAIRRKSRQALSKKEKADFFQKKSKVTEYNKCRERVIAGLKEIELNLDDELKKEMNKIKTHCDQIFPRGKNRGENRRRNLAIKSCKIDEANRIGCTKCVEQLTKISTSSIFLKNMNMQMQQITNLSCFNHKTIGKMACEAASLVTAAGGLTLAATRLVKNLGQSAAKQTISIAQDQAAKIKSQKALATGKNSADIDEVQGTATESSESEEESNINL